MTKTTKSGMEYITKFVIRVCFVGSYVAQLQA